MGTIGFLIPKNMSIDIKIVTLALLEAKLWPNMWFRWRPFWMCHKTRLRGGKNWTPIFLAYLLPNEAIKIIKSILATEMAKMTYRTRLMGVLLYFLVSTRRQWHEILKFVSAFLNLKMSKFAKYCSSNWRYVLILIELLILDVNSVCKRPTGLPNHPVNFFHSSFIYLFSWLNKH